MSDVPPSPPDDERALDAAADQVEDSVVGDCPRCGTPYESGQEYCLECGLRLPTVVSESGVVSTGPAGRGPTFPAAWIALVLVFLVIAALGAAAAIAFSRDDDGGSTVAATENPPPAPSTRTTTAGRPATTARTTRTTRTTRTAPTRPAEPAALVEWPARDGWTVVLISLPKQSGLPAAREQARSAGRAGLRQVGVLDSDRHASLHPGYYVVFSGVYDSREDADAAVAGAASNGYRGAYARQVTS